MDAFFKKGCKSSCVGDRRVGAVVDIYGKQV